jgi:hypothetical protein
MKAVRRKIGVVVGVFGLAAPACGGGDREVPSPPAVTSECGTQADNLVLAGNFDTSAEGFAPGSWDPQDARGCAGSGSLHIASRSRSEPFGVTSGKYRISYFAKNDSSATSSGCDIDFCRSMTCGATLILRTFSLAAVQQSTSWTEVEELVEAPAGTVAARLTCGAGGGEAKASFDRFSIVRTDP